MSIGAHDLPSRKALPRWLWSSMGFNFALVGFIAFTIGSIQASIVASAVFFLVAIFIFQRLPLRYPHDRFGWCNMVTLVRAGMTAVLFAFALTGIHGWPVLIIATVALALDGVDGWMARYEELSSSFGARFDMETDAALALVLALHVWLTGMTGAEILVLGLTRYIFVMAFLPFPWLSAPLPERFGRKVVCVIQIAALIVLQAPNLPAWGYHSVAWTAVAALLWSFGYDTAWLWRHRK